jgi:hypothetical protein
MSVLAVYDCMFFFMRAARPHRVRETFQLVETDKVSYCLSAAVVSEIQDVLTKPRHQRQFPELTPDRVIDRHSRPSPQEVVPSGARQGEVVFPWRAQPSEASLAGRNSSGRCGKRERAVLAERCLAQPAGQVTRYPPGGKPCPILAKQRKRRGVWPRRLALTGGSRILVTDFQVAGGRYATLHLEARWIVRRGLWSVAA